MRDAQRDVPLDGSNSSMIPRLTLSALLMAISPIAFGSTQYFAALAVLISVAAASLFTQSRGVGKISPSTARPLRLRNQTSVSIVVVMSILFCLHGWDTHRAHPRTADELCSLGQARAFTSLSATLPLTAFSKHEDPTNACFARSENGYFSVQGPGWPALLATLRMCGIPQENVPWLIATTTLFLTGLAGLMLAGLPVAIMSMVVLANNQFFDEISRSLWSHSACMLFVTTAIVCMLALTSPQRKNQRLVLAILGISIGMAMLTRALVGISCGFGVIGALALFISMDNGALLTRRNAMLFAAGPATAFILYGLFNLGTTGSFFLSGYEFVHGAGHNPGLFHVAPNGIAHTPERAWMLLHHHVRHLVQFVLPYRWVFWAVIALSVTIGWNARVASIVVTLCAMWLGAATYWDSSYFVGPRFYYESTIPLTLLITMSMWSLTERVSLFIRSPRLARIAHVGIFVLVSLLLLPSPPVQ